MSNREANFYLRIIPAVIGFAILAYVNARLCWAVLLITASLLMWIEVKWERLKNRIWHCEKRSNKYTLNTIREINNLDKL